MTWPRPLRSALLLGVGFLSLLGSPGAGRASEPDAKAPPGLVWADVEPGGALLFDTRAGRVRVPAEALREAPRRVHRSLEETVARAATRGLTAPAEAPWRWREDPLLGGCLLAGDGGWLIVPEGALERRILPRRDVRRERTQVALASAALQRAIAETPTISAWMAGALVDILQKLDDEPGDPSKAALDPAFARRVVADPRWLPAVAEAADAGARKAVVDALREAASLSLRAQYAGEGRTWSLWQDAWGLRAEVYATPEATHLATEPPHPMDDGRRMKVLRTCRVVTHLAAGADPIDTPTDLAAAAEVSLVRGRTRIARWTKADGLQVDRKHWRTHFAAPEGTYLRDGFPPHIAIADARGTLHGVAVPGGVLRPAADHGAQEGERFLQDAARLLPTAAYLDLLQQYFLRYVWDSPDLTQPLMLGCEKFHDEIHQTSAQILETCAGGVCRGDCDDVAEFIQDIATRQGKLAHVVNLPGHLATVWTEKRGDKVHAYVLQSGPGHEFERADVPSALEAAYLELDRNAPFDRNNVSVSLRFDGQNTRSSYGLSWRIFADRAYADLMIDVQADWNRMTLLRAEQKMLRVLESGDRSTANYTELAALYGWMDRNAEAVQYDRLALASRTEPESALLKRNELINNLVQAGQREEAAGLVDEVRTRMLPGLTESLGLRALVIGLQLAGSLSSEAPELASQLLASVATLEVEGVGGSLLQLLAPDRAPEAWRKHEENEALQSLMEDYTWTAIATLRELAGPVARDEPYSVVRATMDVWLARHAFDGVEEPEAIADRWTLRARRLALDDPALLETLAGATPPPSAAGVSHAGLSATATRADILSWTRASPWYFAYVVGDLVADEEKRPDPALMKRLGGWMEESVAHARRLGLYGPDAEAEVRRARLRIALLTQDADGVRTAFRASQALHDRYEFESVSAALGWAAVHLELPWWKRVVSIWMEEIDNRVNYFNIVWRAIGVKAIPHALHVADLAVQRHPEDAALQEEAKLVRARYAK